MVDATLTQAGVKANLSPRIQQCDSTTFTQGLLENTDCLGFFNMEQEKAIGLATDWPFDPLGPGECLVPASYAS